jgi:hypothetical protein
MSEESIYNLIPQPVPVPYKDPLYISKHDGKKPPTFSTFGLTGTSRPGYKNVDGAEAEGPAGHHSYRKSFATMGKEGNAIPPTQILKKRTGGGGGATDYAAAQQTGMFKYSDRLRPAVPTKKECAAERKALREAQGGGETKNFITSNAVENILAVPKRDPEPVDWLKKPHFGAIPPYLEKIKQEISDEYEYIKSMQQQQDEEGPPGLRLMADDEREELITSLKTKWGEVNEKYQQTSVLSLASLDTIGKVKRKEQYEAQLAQIEKDIEKLSKKSVYVHDEM